MNSRIQNKASRIQMQKKKGQTCRAVKDGELRIQLQGRKLGG